jgi:hypothetical protein
MGKGTTKSLTHLEDVLILLRMKALDQQEAVEED